MEPVTIKFARARETKNTIRFEAVEDDQPVDTVYIRKAALRALGDPDKVTLTLAPSA